MYNTRHDAHKSGPQSKQQTTTAKREKLAYLFSRRNWIIAGSRGFGGSFGSWKNGYQNVWRDGNRNFGHKERFSFGKVETLPKK